MEIVLSGLITGAVFAIAASGLVVTYSTSGVFNFAHGALGMLCAYVYWDLRVNDRHTWPLLPKGRWPAPLALVVVVGVIAPLLGAVIHRVVVRGLRDTSELVKLVVPISMLLASIALANWVWKTDRPHSLPPFFGADRKVTIAGVVLLWHDLTILAVAVLLAIGLRILLFRTRIGVTMRASVDDDALLELNGADADTAAMASWMIGVSLSAVAGILITPFQGGSLSSTLLTLLVVNAFAAAMVGRLRSLPLTFAGALVLGWATRAAFPKPTGLIPQSFDWGGNFRLAVPMILLFVVLMVLPQDRVRSTTAARTREELTDPSLRAAAVAAAVFVVVIAMMTALMEAAPLVSLAEALAAALIALSLVVLVGFAGEMSLATMALAGISGTVLYHHVGHRVDDRTGVLAIVVAVAVTALVGGVIALPALRLKGLYLALATAAFSIAVEQILFKEFSSSRRIFPLTMIGLTLIAVVTVGRSLLARRMRRAAVRAAVAAGVLILAGTNPWLRDERWAPLFPNGNLPVPRPRLLGFDLASQQRYVMFLAIVVALIGIGLVALRRSVWGRRLTAMKNAPTALSTMGVDLVRVKFGVFVLSGALAGLGGCLYAMQIGSVTAGRFSLFESMTMLMLLVVAGVGYVSGGVVAGLLYAAVFVGLRGVLGLAADVDALHGVAVWLTRFTTLMPAIIGIGLGRDPNGFLRDAYARFRASWAAAPTVLWGALVVVLAAWGLAVTDTIGNWWFVAVLAVVLLALPHVAEMVGARRAPKETSPTYVAETTGVGRALTSDEQSWLEREFEVLR